MGFTAQDLVSGRTPFPGTTGANPLTSQNISSGGISLDNPMQYYQSIQDTNRLGLAQTDNSGGAYNGGSYAQQQAAQQAAQTKAAYETQKGNLNDLLGRAQTGLNQGLSSLNDQYQGNVNQQNNNLKQANQGYDEQQLQTTKDKQSGYNTANRNANNGYRSLAQIIGRGSGTGSSAFRELLPDVVGKDLSGKRQAVDTTYAGNTAGIKKARDTTALSFQNILADLSNQRTRGERDLRTGVEGQRQTIMGQQQQLEASQNNMDGVNALQGQIQNSRSAVDNFFNQYKPTIQAQQAPIATADLQQYKVDRSNVNALQGGASDPSNPYASILRKKLSSQGGL